MSFVFLSPYHPIHEFGSLMLTCLLCFKLGFDMELEWLADTSVCSSEEESTVIVGRQGRSKARSLTLEEATDTILLCSSIVHDLAYQAATIAIEKEQSVPLEGSQPTVTILGKSNTERKEARGRTIGRRSVKSQKGRQKRMETDAGPPASKTENDENENENVDESLQQRPVGLPPNKVDGMKPPKLESKCNCTIM